MSADGDTSEDTRTSSDIDMSRNDWGAWNWATGADGDLLKQQAVRADLSFWMNHNTVRMGHQQTSSNLRVQWYVRSCNGAPETMLQDDKGRKQ
jgi:hypothetical protein